MFRFNTPISPIFPSSEYTLCPQGHKVEFICFQPHCTDYSRIKCSQQFCRSKYPHTNCARQITVAAIKKKRIEVQKSSSFNKSKHINFGQKSKKLLMDIHQIENIICSMHQQEWGLLKQYRQSKTHFNFLRNKQIYDIYHRSNYQIYYPFETFFTPKQFQEQLKFAIAYVQALKNRTEDHFKCYQYLAEGSVFLQKIHLNQNEQQIFIDLQKCFKFLNKAIQIRFNQLGNIFQGKQFEILESEKSDYNQYMRLLYQKSTHYIKQWVSKGMYTNARQIIDRVQQLFRDTYFDFKLPGIKDIQLQYCTAKTYYFEQKYYQCVEILQRLHSSAEIREKLQRLHGSAEIRDMLKVCYRKTGNNCEYEKILTQIYARNSQNQEILKQFGNFCHQNHKMANSLEIHKKLLKILQEKVKKPQSAEQNRRYLQEKEKLIWRCIYALGDIEKSVQLTSLYSQLIELAKKAQNYSLQLNTRLKFVDLKYRNSESEQEALKSTELGIERCDDLLQYQQIEKGFILQFKCKFLLLKGKFVKDKQEKYKIYEQVIQLSQKNKLHFYEAYQNRLNISVTLKQFNDVIINAKKAINAYPTAESYYQLSFAHYKLYLQGKEKTEKQQNLQNAIKAVQSGLKLRERNYDLLNLAGILYSINEEYQKSNQYYCRSVQCGPKTAEILSRIGKNKELIEKFENQQNN